MTVGTASRRATSRAAASTPTTTFPERQLYEDQERVWLKLSLPTELGAADDDNLVLELGNDDKSQNRCWILVQWPVATSICG